MTACSESSSAGAARPRPARDPRTIRVDQGSEFVSRDFDPQASAPGATLDVSRPGEPTDAAFIEACSGNFRSERLDAHGFLALADAAKRKEGGLGSYNAERPHGAISRKAPVALANRGGDISPPP